MGCNIQEDMMKTKILLIFFVAFPLFAGELGENKREKYAVNSTEIFKKISLRKYEKMIDQLRLTSDEQKKLFPILKKYDEKLFQLRENHRKEHPRNIRDFQSDGQVNYTQYLKKMNVRMGARAKMAQARYRLFSQEIIEFQNKKITDELIVKVLQFEKRFDRAVMKQFRQHHRKKSQRGDRRQKKGGRGSFGFGPER